MEISWGIVAMTSPLAVHIACDVGNRVHTRNDSDEDVCGNACKKAIAWKALPFQANKCNLCYLPELNVEVKPSRQVLANPIISCVSNLFP